LVGGDDAGERVAVHLADKAAVGFHLGAGVADEVGGFGHFPQGFHAVFAHFQRHRRGNFVDALVDNIGQLAQQVNALIPIHAAPGGEGGLGGSHRVGGVLRCAFLEGGQVHICVDGGVGVVLIGGEALLPVDEHGVLAPEFAFYF